MDTSFKGNSDNKSSIHTIQPTIDYHCDLDLLGNSEVPRPDIEQLVKHYGTTNSNKKIKMINKLSNSNSNSRKEKEKANIAMPGNSIIKHLKGYKISNVTVFFKGFGRILCMKNHKKITIWEKPDNVIVI